eukprot:gb/GECG01007556.1/.p1 GENE.gb/GECG01007556.1/~~gb/GECG01007556.1/.p1  ORF type:complete len:255 (+),score=23.81 gb/GECG01007556.1/:1-765(+)
MHASLNAKMPEIRTAVVLLALGILSIALRTNASLDYKRVHVVDKSQDNRNWLFRGNFPSTHGPNGSYVYGYDVLLQYLHKRALDEGGHSLPSNFELEVISFDNVFNIPWYWMEVEYFKKHPGAGNLTLWPIVGAVLPPQYVDNQTRKSIVDDPSLLFSIDKLPSRIRVVHDWVHTVHDVPKVIFWHCDAGCDRTGEVSGAYYVRYQGYNISAALDRDVKDCGREPSYFSRGMLGWYCLYYENTTGTDIGNCLNV